MKVNEAKFLRGITGTNDILENGIPQVALIGRSNVGKSSLINSLTEQKDLARISDKPGLTQQINVYGINNNLYLLDLPGYGYAKVPGLVREKLQKLIWWYLFDSPYIQRKVLLIIDANVGVTKNDLEMLSILREHSKRIVIVANKIDKIKKPEYEEHMKAIAEAVGGDLTIIPYSAHKKIGVDELLSQLESA